MLIVMKAFFFPQTSFLCFFSLHREVNIKKFAHSAAFWFSGSIRFSGTLSHTYFLYSAFFCPEQKKAECRKKAFFLQYDILNQQVVQREG